MSRYSVNKERVRKMAIEWQYDFYNHNYSWGDLAVYSEMFTRLGKRYGLIKEFRENGII